jgi:RHH-type proline utilization regulon transcriptional repressor/proline dehydrogenase/delta 1-pyrroline-5-carboxylate dehydrogenase
VLDVVQSGFNSAGQRCSALRVLLVQEEIAERVQTLLAGSMDEIVVGDPARLATDVGPVIDDEALKMLENYGAAVVKQARWSHRAPVPAGARGRFFAPLAVEIDSLSVLEREVFGPIVHVVRYRARDLDSLVAAINRLGYGLTLGIHTRIDGLAQRVARSLRVGNVYINRNMIGAVVGVQPSAAWACPVPVPRRVGRTICIAWPPSRPSPPTRRPSVATPGCRRWPRAS